MGDDGLAGPPAKKRGATRQIAKDDRSDSDDDGFLPSESGSFQKASDEVIANRRIVKVRRSVPSQAPAAPNPFASIRLVAPTASSGVPPAPSPSVSTLDLPRESGEKQGEVLVKDQFIQINSRVSETQAEKGEVESTSQSLELVDAKLQAQTGDEEEQRHENVEGKAELIKSPATGDDHKDKEVSSEVDTGNDPASSLTTNMGKIDDVQSEDNVSDAKAQVDDGLEHNKEEEVRASKEEDNVIDVKGLVEENIEQNKEEDVRASTVANAGTAQESNVVGISKVGVIGENSCVTVKAAAARSFSFGTSPFAFETPTAFASFSSTWAAFGSSGASGTNLGTGFSSGTAGSEGAFTSTSSPFSGSNGSSFQLFKSSQSSGAPLNTGPALQPPASVVQFQGGMTPTGEEEEKMVFGMDATLFEFADGSWKERGKGELRINVPSGKAGKARLLMRSKGNYRLILNANLYADMKMTNMDSRGVTFACVNSAVEKSGLATYALKFKDSMAASSFRDAVDANKYCPNESLKTPENSPSSLYGL